MGDGKVHSEISKSPWERRDAYRVPEIRMGRPDLPGAEAEIEGLLRLIGTLPKEIPWQPGHGNILEVAHEVRALLEPRIAIVTLGKGDVYAEWYLWGHGNAPLRCATLCLPHPTEERWKTVADRNLLFEGEACRARLSRCIARAARQAIQELNRHWLHSPMLTQR